jgi:hypothetical protein
MIRRIHLIGAVGIMTIVMIIFTVPITTQAAVAPIPFGGVITLIRPCIGASFVVATILQPPPLPPIEVAAAASPFLYYVMKNSKQFVLGLLTNPTFCLLSPHSGFTVPMSVFYGTSAI